MVDASYRALAPESRRCSRRRGMVFIVARVNHPGPSGGCRRQPRHVGLPRDRGRRSRENLRGLGSRRPDHEGRSRGLGERRDGRGKRLRSVSLGVPRRLRVGSVERSTWPRADVFESDYGLDLEGWTLLEATGISADGRTFVEWGAGPADYEQCRRGVVRMAGAALAVLCTRARTARLASASVPPSASGTG